MVAAFTGWNDAADAASGAVDHLWERWGAQRFATIDPDEFVDFTVCRPDVRVEDGIPGPLDWPETELGWCSPTGSISVVLVRGPEPHFRWPLYCNELVDAADELGCSTIITLGAMLSEVPHTRAVPVFSAVHDPQIIESLDLPRSEYAGPTGIPSALQETANERGLESLGLWAALPGYAAGVRSPIGALSLVDQVAQILGVEVDNSALVKAAAQYATELDALVAEDEETAAYLVRLEAAYDSDGVALGSVDSLVSEVEDFLRDQP